MTYSDPEFYFAYGSNLSSQRLKARIPNVKVIGNGWLSGWRFTMLQPGADLSGKCNIVRTKDLNDIVWGVLYDICGEGKAILDDIEGAHSDYSGKNLEIISSDKKLKAYGYTATAVNADDEILPFEWYKNYVIDGALEHGLPADYIAMLKCFSHQPDNN
jgi:hypothetical protein